MAVDVGSKRTGLAVSDPGQKIAFGLATVESHKIWEYLEAYFLKEKVDEIVVGQPLTLAGKPSQGTPFAEKFAREFERKFSSIARQLMEERFTSKMATLSRLESGVKKMDRRDKEAIDQISATILLQNYLLLLENKKR